jgi:putative (di)nucleoside polyphosphate hydrolase
VTEIRYSPNVAAILRNRLGEIFLGERVNMAGAWQFPQGGIDAGETPEEALVRELREEIGIHRNDFRIVERKGPYLYLFGEGRMKKGFHGKEQLYFLCDFLGDDRAIDVTTEHPEFRAWRWLAPENFQMEWLPAMKREVYRAVWRDFFSLKI